MLGHTSADRAVGCTVLVGSASSLEIPPASEVSLPSFNPLRRGWIYRLAPEACLFRGMPTGPQAFLKMPGTCGLRPRARTYLKKALCHTRPRNRVNRYLTFKVFQSFEFLYFIDRFWWRFEVNGHPKVQHLCEYGGWETNSPTNSYGILVSFCWKIPIRFYWLLLLIGQIGNITCSTQSFSLSITAKRWTQVQSRDINSMR